MKFYLSWITVCIAIILCGFFFGGCEASEDEIQEIEEASG